MHTVFSELKLVKKMAIILEIFLFFCHLRNITKRSCRLEYIKVFVKARLIEIRNELNFDLVTKVAAATLLVEI